MNELPDAVPSGVAAGLPEVPEGMGTHGEDMHSEHSEHSEIDALRAELAAAQELLAEAQDKYLRTRAEVENARRRAETDVANAHKYAVERFALEMLAVKDGLERACAAAGMEAVAPVIEGVGLTLKLAETAFQKFSLAEIAPVRGDRFDPERHQAMSMIPVADLAPNHVAQVLQKGYLLHGRVIRPALVLVATAAANSPGT